MLDDRRRIDDAGRVLDRLHRGVRQPGLEEAGDAQVGTADEVANGPVDRLVERGAEGQRGRQDGNAEGDPDDREQRAKRPRGDRAPRQPIEAHGARGRPGRAER